MDACVNGYLIQALQEAGWDAVRAVDLYPEGALDPIVFAGAAQQERVFVTNDAPIAALAHTWLAEGRSFRMIFWPQEGYTKHSVSSFVRAFEALAARDQDPFSKYSIVYLTPAD